MFVDLFVLLPCLKDDMDLFDYNVPDRVNDFVSAAISQVRCRELCLHLALYTLGQFFIC